jgi:hypothetical protein
MPTITITLTDTQLKGLEYSCNAPQEYADNALHNQARIANDEIIKIYTDRALDEGIQIPATRELIIEDAFARGWVQTAADAEAAMIAAQQAEVSEEETPSE